MQIGKSLRQLVKEKPIEGVFINTSPDLFIYLFILFIHSFVRLR